MSFTPNAERHQPRWVKGEVGEFEADLVQALRPVLRQHEQLLPDRRPWCMCGHRAETPGSREQHLLEVVATAVVAALNLPERDRETAAKALEEFSAEVLADYEERTDRVGSYGQTKIRAALLTAGRMAAARASALREGRES